MAKPNKVDVYEIVTQKIIDSLESGVLPWRKPWRNVGGVPIKLSNMKPYRGINVWILLVTSHLNGYESPYWGTYNQLQARGAQVRKGEKGTQVVLYKRVTYKKKNDQGEEEENPYMLLRYFTVFNADQCDGEVSGIPEDANAGNPFTPLEQCEAVVKGMPQRPEIRHGGNVAGYQTKADYVTMPKPEQFESAERYYATLFHELGHSTGHEDRLARDDMHEYSMQAESYSKEELIAEMTSAFLCGTTGIEAETLDASAAYIEGWLKRLTNDRKMVVNAAKDAAKASDFILGVKFEADSLTESAEGATVAA